MLFFAAVALISKTYTHELTNSFVVNEILSSQSKSGCVCLNECAQCLAKGCFCCCGPQCVRFGCVPFPSPHPPPPAPHPHPTPKPPTPKPPTPKPPTPSACAAVFPKTGPPLAQTNYGGRPPQQTAEQSKVCQQNVLNAAKASSAALPWLQTYLGSAAFRTQIHNLSIANATTAELVAMLTWEFKRLPILHNGPLNTNEDPAISDDSDLTTTLSNGYLQNVCQRYVLGVEGKTNFENEGAISEKYMHYRPFENKERPTLREANDRVMYLATNLQKTDCGNFIYGKITYVINPLYQDKFFISPWDTGAYANCYGKQTPFGTLDHFYHLVQPHL